MGQVVLPHADVASPVACVDLRAISVTAVTHEGAVVAISVAIDTSATAFFFVIRPVTFIGPTSVVPTSVDYFALSVLEAIFESARVDVSAQSPQYAFPFHLAHHEIALIYVTILKLQATFTGEVSGDSGQELGVGLDSLGCLGFRLVQLLLDCSLLSSLLNQVDPVQVGRIQPHIHWMHLLVKVGPLVPVEHLDQPQLLLRPQLYLAQSLRLELFLVEHRLVLLLEVQTIHFSDFVF